MGVCAILLQDTLESYAKKLTLQLDLKAMDTDQLKWLKKTVQSHKGKHNLDMAFYEVDSQIKLLMHSRKKKVHISTALLEALDEKQIHFKLN